MRIALCISALLSSQAFLPLLIGLQELGFGFLTLAEAARGMGHCMLGAFYAVPLLGSVSTAGSLLGRCPSD